MEMPEGWKRLSAKQYSVLIPVEKSLAKEVVYSLDLMREMSEVLEELSRDTDFVWDGETGYDQRQRAYECFDKSSKKAGLVMEKFKSWK